MILLKNLKSFYHFCKNTFSIIGNDRNTLFVLSIPIIFDALFVTMLAHSLINIFIYGIDSYLFAGIAAVLLLIGKISTPFFHISGHWIVHNQLLGNTLTLPQAIKHAMSFKSDIKKLTAFFWGTRIGRHKKEEDLNKFESKLFQKAELTHLYSHWGLANLFVLPILATHTSDFEHTSSELDSLQESLPKKAKESFESKFDYFQEAYVQTRFIKILALFGFVLIADSAEDSENLINILSNYFIAYLLISAVANFTKTSLELCANLYLTILSHSESIDKERAQEVLSGINSLLMDSVQSGPNQEQGVPAPPSKPSEDKVVLQCFKAFKVNLAKGHTREKVSGFLESKGTPKEKIDIAWNQYEAELLKKYEKHIPAAIAIIEKNIAKGISFDKIKVFLKSKKYPDVVIDHAYKLCNQKKAA